MVRSTPTITTAVYFMIAICISYVINRLVVEYYKLYSSSKQKHHYIGDIFALIIVSMFIYNVPSFVFDPSMGQGIAWTTMVLATPLLYNVLLTMKGCNSNLSMSWGDIPIKSRCLYIVSLISSAVLIMYKLIQSRRTCNLHTSLLTIAIIGVFLLFACLGKWSLTDNDEVKFHIHHWFIGFAMACVLSVCNYGTFNYVFHGFFLGVMIHGASTFSMSVDQFFR